MRTSAAVASFTISVLRGAFGPPAGVEVGRGVEIRPAGKKGLGAFATQDLAAGTYLAPYTGRLLERTDALTLFDQGETSGAYFAELNGWLGDQTTFIIDAEDDKSSGWPRYVNPSRRRANTRNVELRQPVSLPGVDGGPLIRLPLGLYLQLTQDVQAGDELLTDYGDEYWTDRGLLPLDPRRLAIDYL